MQANMQANTQTNAETSVYFVPNNHTNNTSNIILNRPARKCSFCRCQGHNITRCNNTMLSTVNSYLIYLKNHFMTLHAGNRILAIQDFENYLYSYCGQSDDNTKLLKHVGSRFYSSRLRSMIQIVINKILLSLFDIDIAWLTFHEYNFIPFNENTPVRLSCILTGILLNYQSNEFLNNTYNANAANAANAANFDTNIIFTNAKIKIEQSELDNQHISTCIECSICYNNVEKSNCATLECKHEYCVVCVEQMLDKQHTNCPYCREQIKKINCYNEEAYNKLANISNLS